MKYQVGQRITGIINNISDLGIFLTLPKQTSGLIHHSDFVDNWARERRNYQVGQSVRVVVLNVYKGKIALSKMRVNDPSLADRTNQFTKVKNEDFGTVLTQTVADGQKELEKLQQELASYAD